MKEKEIKLPPRVHCFQGERVDLNDVCQNFECVKIECLWHRLREMAGVDAGRGRDNNHLESMSGMKIG